MKAKLRILVVFLIVVAIGFTVNIFQNRYDASLNGKVETVTWEYVNVRKNHSTSSEIISTLVEGDKVTLTGKIYESFGGEGLAEEMWKEVKLSNNTTGWMVFESIR